MKWQRKTRKKCSESRESNRILASPKKKTKIHQFQYELFVEWIALSFRHKSSCGGICLRTFRVSMRTTGFSCSPKMLSNCSNSIIFWWIKVISRCYVDGVTSCHIVSLAMIRVGWSNSNEPSSHIPIHIRSRKCFCFNWKFPLSITHCTLQLHKMFIMS